MADGVSATPAVTEARMNTVIQPLAWGLALASILATASSLALDLVASTVQPVAQNPQAVAELQPLRAE